MKITLSHIPEDGLNLQFEKDREWFFNALPEKEKRELSLQRVEVVCYARKLKETIVIEGSFTARVTANCSRCLEVTDFPVESAFRYTLVPAESKLKDEQELSAEDLEFIFYEDDVIDLDAMLFEQIMLHIPMRVLCRDACKGLCPLCGTDLNTGICHCRPEIVDERLAVLKKLKKEE